jgi:hypothetical protein
MIFDNNNNVAVSLNTIHKLSLMHKNKVNQVNLLKYTLNIINISTFFIWIHFCYFSVVLYLCIKNNDSIKSFILVKYYFC